MKKLLFFFMISITANLYAQQKLTPELLWKLGRVSALGISKDKQYLIYNVTTPNIELNRSENKTYRISVNGGNAEEIFNPYEQLSNEKISSDGKYIISSNAVKLKSVYGSDYYPTLTKSNVKIYESLNYRHWDTWEDGKYDHVFFAPFVNGKAGIATDIMKDELIDCPLKPFGGEEDFIWNPDGKHIVYSTKKKFGTEYALSTNTDLYEYDITTGSTKNLTADNKGYDNSPAYNAHGQLAWLQMKRDGYEADKQDLIVSNGITKMNLTGNRDDIHVESFKWSEDGKSIFFIAPQKGMVHVFQVTYPNLTKMLPEITQLTKGEFEVNGIVGQVGNKLIISKVDFNHATEFFSLDLSNGN